MTLGSFDKKALESLAEISRVVGEPRIAAIQQFGREVFYGLNLTPPEPFDSFRMPTPTRFAGEDYRIRYTPSFQIVRPNFKEYLRSLMYTYDMSGYPHLANKVKRRRQPPYSRHQASQGHYIMAGALNAAFRRESIPRPRP